MSLALSVDDWRFVIDDCRTRQKDVSIVFVDFRKAFDSVSRPAIAWLLNIYGVPPSLTSAILDPYIGSSAFVQTPHGRSEEFTTTSGVLCLLYTSPSPRDLSSSRMPSSA